MVLKLCCFILKDVAVITSSLEEDVTLKCLDSHEQYQEKCYRGRWIKYDNGQEEIILPETTKAQQDRWINWTPAEDGHMSLRLRKLKKSDEGLYRCEIWRDWTCVYVKNVTLKLRGEIYRFIFTSRLSQRTDHS